MAEKALEPRVTISNRCERLCFKEVEVVAFFSSLATLGGEPVSGALSIAFLSDAEIARLHERYLNDPEPTDVLTFPGDPGEDFAGEICVSAERAWLESRDRGVSFSSEMCLYLVHGWLHLQGYDDRSEQERMLMRRAEEETLAEVEAQGAMPVFAMT